MQAQWPDAQEIEWLLARRFNVLRYGAVLGANVGQPQYYRNVMAFRRAVYECKQVGQGIIEVPGLLLVDQALDTADDLVDLPAGTSIMLEGRGGNTNGATIKYVGTATVESALSLKGSIGVTIRDLTIDAGGKALYALYCARTNYPATAGKHSFQNLFLQNARIAAHANYGSEENTYLKVRAQRSPIGGLFTSHPIFTDANAPNTFQTSRVYAVGDKALPTVFDPDPANWIFLLCTQAGTSGGTGTEPTWNPTPGGLTTTGGAIFSTQPLYWGAARTYVASGRGGNGIVMPDTGYYYEATTVGVTGLLEPTWPTTVGGTVADGTVTWTCRADARVPFVVPCDADGEYNDASAMNFVNCAWGSAVTANPTARCGLLVFRAQIRDYQGVTQTSPKAEAYILIDGTMQRTKFDAHVMDSGLARNGIRTGYYSPATSDFNNQFTLDSMKFTISPDATYAGSYLDLKNAVGCLIEGCDAGGPTPAINYGFVLQDNLCKGNTFINNFYAHDTGPTQITITNTGTATNNVRLGPTGLAFIAPSGSTSPSLSYSGTGALKVQNTLTLNPPIGTTAESILRQGESVSIHTVSHQGVHSWGDGTSATDTTLLRQGAGLLRTAGGFQALNWSEATFTETTGAGVYTGSVAVPAGAWLVDIKVRSTALWTATTSALMDVGDVGDPNGWYAGIDLEATDLLVGEEISFDQPGGKNGAYLDNATGLRAAYSASARTISGVITTVGAAGSAGRTRLLVIFASPISAAATKV